jgi:hypothetical protein
MAMGKNALLDQIGRGLRFSKYELSQYDEDVLVAFLEDGQAIYVDIPADMITLRVQMAAAEFDQTGMLMQNIQPNDTTQYKALAIAAVASDWRNLKDVATDCIDQDFMNSVLEQTPEALVAFFTQDPAMVEKAFDQTSLEQFLMVNQSALFATISAYVSGGISTNLITDTFIQKMTMSMAGLGSKVFKSSRQHLMLDGIRDGGWPETLFEGRPVDLEQGIKRAMKPTSSLKLDWHKAYIKSHDIKEVVKAMKTPQREEMLLSLYTREELQPHMLKNQRVKGKWLSDELGL